MLRSATRHAPTCGRLAQPQCPTAPLEVPNLHVVAGERWRAITSFVDPTPELRTVEKRLLKYRRRDGVELSGTLYLPTNVPEGKKLPLLR